MKQLKVLWLGFAVPDPLARTLFAADPLPAIQTHKFGWSLARALRHAFGEVTLASACPVQNYPLVRRIIFRGSPFRAEGMSGELLGFVNVIGLKHLTRMVSCLTTVAPLLRKQHIDWIFIHGVHTPYLIFGLLTHLAGRRVAVVLTDPPGVMLNTDGRVARWMKGVDAWLVKKILGHADAVLALAPDLPRIMAPGCPALVFPGILESTLSVLELDITYRSDKEIANRPFTIVYAGGLTAAYGVDRLIEAIRGFEAGRTVRLKLFGRGDQEGLIQEAAALDPRIKFGGFIDMKALLPELCTADLLINPRPTHQAFASQSFPSKLIEYLATGRPVLTTRIPGIPDALKKYYHFIEDESASGIRSAILSVIHMSPSRLAERAQAARLYARTELTEEATGKKIANFIACL